MSGGGRFQKGNAHARNGNGAGWGGKAKGAGNGKSKVDFGATTNAQGHSKTTAATRAERRRERADALEDHLYQLAMHAEQERDQINAAARLHAICDGMPIARQEVKLNVSPDEMTDAELVAMLRVEEGGNTTH